jgi:acyl dehydratase
MYLPGKGSLYISQTCNFKRPVKIGDTLRAECEVMEKQDRGRILMQTRCINQHGDVVVEGEALASAARKVEDVI